MKDTRSCLDVGSAPREITVFRTHWEALLSSGILQRWRILLRCCNGMSTDHNVAEAIINDL